jgi:hypothetical protein
MLRQMLEQQRHLQLHATSSTFLHAQVADCCAVAALKTHLRRIYARCPAVRDEQSCSERQPGLQRARRRRARKTRYSTRSSVRSQVGRCEADEYVARDSPTPRCKGVCCRENCKCCALPAPSFAHAAPLHQHRHTSSPHTATDSTASRCRLLCFPSTDSAAKSAPAPTRPAVVLCTGCPALCVTASAIRGICTLLFYLACAALAPSPRFGRPVALLR